MDWQRLFRSHILDRGFQYYKQGSVEDYWQGEDFIEATVQGSEAYDVSIDIIDGKIIEMYCNCPYAEEGNYCKHMAAVLFYMEENHDSFNVKKTWAGSNKLSEVVPLKGESVRGLVEKTDEKVIRDFLINILENDGKMFNRFRSVLCCKVSPMDMKRYKNQIDGIFRNYAGRYGFVDYYNAGSFILELEEVLDHDVIRLVENKQFEEAFELTNYIFVKTGNQDMDDSDGGTGMLADRCLEIWQEIIENSDMEMKRKMFQWYTEHLDGSIIDYMEAYIEQLLFENFMEEEFLLYKLKLTEKKVCTYKNEKDSWTRGYHAGMWALKHIGVMKEQKTSEDLIDKYCKENLEFSSVRDYYVNRLIYKGKYDAAIQVLEEGKVVDKSFPGLVEDYSLKLKDLYQQTGNNQAYEKELWSFVLEYRAGDLDAYKELESLYSKEEWEEKREVIFKNLPSHAPMDKLYEMEKLYDRLLKIVLDSAGIYKLTEYEKCLKPLYPEELLVKYEATVKNMASRVSDRKRYKEIVAILRRMQKYPEGMNKVKELVIGWQLEYRNRPAMMDELRKL
ncbi:SWIM zinc finger family protein [Anaerovorax odorimutans]|uniref:SWIM zinc finger family protein n=1 Tax=Anaerovorax odorimutans TaxID=109327 RepID=UPI0004260DA0|nr:SWIM zinc finger family protein [Anaerovorax odorimutans]